MVDPAIQAALDKVNASTTSLGVVVGKLGDVQTAVATRLTALAQQLASSPTPADVASMATEISVHADTLTATAASIQTAEDALTAMAADPNNPAPAVPAIPVPAAPAADGSSN